MIVCYTHRLVSCPVVLREPSSGHRWEWMQRSTARHYAKRKSKVEISIEFFPLELRESLGRGCR